MGPQSGLTQQPFHAVLHISPASKTQCHPYGVFLTVRSILGVQVKQGNLLVFMSTTGGVNELTQAVQLAMVHDPSCSILPLYAALTEAEKTKVTSFGDLSKFPNNKGKRLICIATNIAEAGVTIPGKSIT